MKHLRTKSDTFLFYQKKEEEEGKYMKVRRIPLIRTHNFPAIYSFIMFFSIFFCARFFFHFSLPSFRYNAKIVYKRFTRRWKAMNSQCSLRLPIFSIFVYSINISYGSLLLQTAALMALLSIKQ